MAFENKQRIDQIDLGWQKADYVSPLVGPENDDNDEDPSKIQIAWFKVDARIAPSESEEKEKMEAMQFQYANKIINKYGLPYGMTMPKEFKKLIQQREEEMKKGKGKWDRQRKRLIDRQIEKDMRAQRRKEKEGAELISFDDLKLFNQFTSKTPKQEEIKEDIYRHENIDIKSIIS